MSEANVVTLPTACEAPPVTQQDYPDCPDFLHADAKAHWEEVMEGYRATHTSFINQLDKDLLSMYCSNYAMWKKADQEVWEEGMTQRTHTGYTALSAAAIMHERLQNSCMKLAKQLGLTPPSRLAMKANVPAEQGDLFTEL